MGFDTNIHHQQPEWLGKNNLFIIVNSINVTHACSNSFG